MLCESWAIIWYSAYYLGVDMCLGYCSMVDFFSFTDSTFNIFNATLHDNMAVKLGYDLSLKCLFRSKSTNVFFSIKSRAKKRKTSSNELVLQKVNGRIPLDLRNLQDIFQTLQQQRLRLS